MDKQKEVECGICESKCTIEFDETTGDDIVYCPFCGETLEEPDEDDLIDLDELDETED